MFERGVGDIKGALALEHGELVTLVEVAVQGLALWQALVAATPLQSFRGLEVGGESVQRRTQSSIGLCVQEAHGLLR